ncbi:MAG TPA: cyclodeaminase/cyclohydrolase family protein [Ktedonobacteraceae bacterium]|nr:cyclodeaminase/cyclohydrolase family protein [Ktedonobacteraceae bacterium]
MYVDEPLQAFLDDLASEKSTPGGGSASAVTGAMGAALASMVARLTLHRQDYAPVHEEMERLLQQTERLRHRFEELMQEDIAAYGQLSKAYKMPRVTDQEKEDRSRAIQAQLVEAALVPLEMMENAAELLLYCERIAEIGNKSVLSDVVVGAMLAASAGAGASWMVRINLQAMKDTELVRVLSDRLSRALDTITAGNQRVTTIVGERV